MFLIFPTNSGRGFCVKAAGMKRRGFFVFPRIEQFGMDSETFCRRLIQEAKVAVLPGTLYGKEGYVRISYSAPMGSLRAGMNRFEEFVNGLK